MRTPTGTVLVLDFLILILIYPDFAVLVKSQSTDMVVLDFLHIRSTPILPYRANRGDI